MLRLWGLFLSPLVMSFSPDTEPLLEVPFNLFEKHDDKDWINLHRKSLLSHAVGASISKASKSSMTTLCCDLESLLATSSGEKGNGIPILCHATNFDHAVFACNFEFNPVHYNRLLTEQHSKQRIVDVSYRVPMIKDTVTTMGSPAFPNNWNIHTITSLSTKRKVHWLTWSSPTMTWWMKILPETSSCFKSNAWNAVKKSAL